MQTYAVGLLRDLPPKRVMRAQIKGQDLVVWRATNGDIAAWDNRCPHRGMALSHGFVRGNALACLYHGWHYNRAGTCSLIPAHPDFTPPETIQTQKFSVVAEHGVIWVNTQAEAQAPTLPMVCRPLRSFYVDAPETAFSDACTQVDYKGQSPVVIGPGHYQLGAVQIVVLQTPIDLGRTQITTLVQDTVTNADCGALSRWCAAVTRRVSKKMQEAA